MAGNKLSDKTLVTNIPDRTTTQIHLYDPDEAASEDQDKRTVIDNFLKGKRKIPVRAAAMKPTTTGGCGALTQTEITANQPEILVMPFDKDSDEHAFVEIPMPENWDGGTITFKVRWAAAGTSTDGVAWAVQARAAGDGDAIDGAYGTAVVVTDDDIATAYIENVTAESAAVTIANTPAAGDTVWFDIYRDVSDANDDLAEDALLLGIDIFYNEVKSDES